MASNKLRRSQQLRVALPQQVPQGVSAASSGPRTVEQQFSCLVQPAPAPQLLLQLAAQADGLLRHACGSRDALDVGGAGPHLPGRTGGACSAAQQSREFEEARCAALLAVGPGWRPQALLPQPQALRRRTCGGEGEGHGQWGRRGGREGASSRQGAQHDGGQQHHRASAAHRGCSPVTPRAPPTRLISGWSCL